MKDYRGVIWFFLLAAILMLCIAGMAETPKHYQKRIHRHLASARERLQDMSRFAHAAGPEAEYLRLADIDLALASDGLHFYRRGQIDRVEMDRLVKQLDRDMETYPPTVPASASPSTPEPLPAPKVAEPQPSPDSPSETAPADLPAR